jgi:phosphatidylserine decarboxylase
MKVWLQQMLPQHAVSRVVLAATRVRTPWFKNLLIQAFLNSYPVDLGEAEQPNPKGFENFNAFFTRALRTGSRPIAPGAADIASPVDGMVSECGPIDGDKLLQAKGRSYSLADLLAGHDWAGRFAGGQFATIYLAPFNYHRIHMPISGELLDCIYVPGRLFSVNDASAQGVPRLFARNERVITRFQSAAGQFALVLVGALNVGSIATVWAGDIAPRRPRVLTRLPHAEVCLRKGAELGRFNMGSTVILLFEPGRTRWDDFLRRGRTLRYGERIGEHIGERP